MTKRLMAKVGEYDKDGQTKGEYIKVGVILENQNGEYALIDPAVNLAGVLMKQRIMNPQKAGGSVLCSVFSDDEQRSQPSQTGGGSDVPF